MYRNLTHPATPRPAAAARLLVFSALMSLCASSALAASAYTTQLLKPSLPIQPIPILTEFMYSAKFVCGAADLVRDVQSSGNPFATPYEDFEPGRYATAVNIFNPTNSTRTVHVAAAAEKLSQNVLVSSLSIGPYQTRRVGCLNIMPEVTKVFQGPQLFGQLIEGFVYLTQRDTNLQVEVVYSYARGAGDSQIGGSSLDVVEVEPHQVDALRPELVPLP